MTKHVRFSELGHKARVLEVHEGATLQEVIDQAKATLSGGTVLTQNGRRAATSDAAKPGATVALMPENDHG